MISFNHIPTTPTSLFSAYASFTASIMLIRSIANELLPPQIQSYISSAIHYLFKPLNSDITLVIEEYCNMFSRNEVYEAAEIYLRTKINPSTQRLRISKTQKQNKLNISIEKGEEVKDNFDNVKLKWLLVYFEPNKFSGEKREFQLTFPRKFKDKVLKFYLPYVLSEANKIKQEERMVKIHTKRSSYGGGEDDDGCGGNQLWGCVNLDHPAKFETLAMDPEMKKKIVDDLDRFVRRREFYKRVGKAWKRGYLLFGPPGTGKSSLIAAMANYLKFDVYDLELSGIYNNAELRRTLLSTTNRSILVIEDVDCSVNMENRQSEDHGYHQNPASQPKFTLSGLLNFIDGLWSSCGDERIIVFTTNHKDKLDPALLRPGRMDMHIHMSYCTSQGFKTLATNYLGIDSYKHHLYKEIEVLIDSTEVTPAEIAEELMKNDDIDVGFGELVNFLKHKRIESDEKKVEDNQQEQKQVEEPIEPQEAKRVKTNRGKGVHMRRRFVRQLSLSQCVGF